METNYKREFKFPTGYKRFHRNQLFNYQLNRPYSFGYARFEDHQRVGPGIRTFTDWKREMIHLAENAALEGRLLSAAFYYRATEFYTKSTDPDKAVLYDKFSGLFYKAIENDELEKHLVP